MPKRILLPVLITTGFLSLGAGTFVATPLITRAKENNKNQSSHSSNSSKFVDDNTNWYGGGMKHFMGKRARSNDLAYAKSLGVDTSKAEDAQNKVKEAEDNLKTELDNVRIAIKDAIIKKAQDQKIDQNLINEFYDANKKLEEDKKALSDAENKNETTVQELNDLRQQVRDARNQLRDAEMNLKDAIK